MEQFDTLVEHCRRISHILTATSRSRPRGSINEPLETEGDICGSPNGFAGSRRFEISQIRQIFGHSFYEDDGFVTTFVKYAHFLSNNTSWSNFIKNRLCCVIIAGSVLNFRTTHIALDVCPDFSLSIALELFEQFENHDEFVLERLLLAKRLENDTIIGRKCSRLLRQCLFNFDLHLYINKLIDTHTDSHRNPLHIAKLTYRLSILSNLSNVLNMCILSNLKNCALSMDEHAAPSPDKLKPHPTQSKSDSPPVDTSPFDIRVITDRIVNRRPFELPVPCFQLFFRPGNCIIDDKLTPNLVQISTHVSYKRGYRCCYSPNNIGPSYKNTSNNNAARVESENGHQTEFVTGEKIRPTTQDVISDSRSPHRDTNAEETYKQMQLRKFGYVVLDKSDELLSKMLFWVDNSIAIVITASGCPNFYVKLLGKKLCMDPSNITNVYTDESTDTKSLVGSWMCSGSSGEFTYNYGVLARAMEEGNWLIFDSHLADSTLAFLLSVSETGEIYINELNKTIKAHEHFQIFIIQSANHGQNYSTKSVVDTIRAEYSVPIIQIPDLTNSDITEICCGLFQSPYTSLLVSAVLSLFEDSGLNVSISHLLKYLNRVSFYFAQLRGKDQNWYHGSQNTQTPDANHINTNLRMLMVYDFYAVFVSRVADPDARLATTSQFGQLIKLHVDSIDQVFGSFGLLKYFLTPEAGFSSSSVSLFNSLNGYTDYNEHILRLVYTCQLHNEPVLLVGETGTGKTELIQKIATLTSNTLKVYIFNESTDTNDLIGTYKPCSSYKDQPPNDQTAEERIEFRFYEGVLVECMKRGYWLLLDEINLAQHDLLNKLYSAISITYDKDRSGSRYIELYECVNQRVEIHPNFRLFACMNPHAVTKKGGLTINSGKKDLPKSFYKLFTAIYVDPIRIFDDLLRVGLKHLGESPLNIKPLIDFYLGILDLVDSCSITDGSLKTPHFSLRNFVRAVKYVKNASGRSENEIATNKIIYDAVCANFLSTLDPDSFEKAESLLQPEIRKFRFDISRVVNEDAGSVNYLEFIKSDNGFADIFGYKIRHGHSDKRHESSNGSHKNEEFVLCTDNIGYLVKLARIVSGIESPILLEGPTGVGKTSIVKFLCQITNHVCVRINNHDGIDVSDYVGQYTFIDNRLVFEYGTLVLAMKHGYWVILDELNLASSEILECLNSVLDENRRIFIPETNETIECHPEFRIFATQNPSDSVYGGRKQLSTAFKNRFIQIYFDEISEADLSVILQRRCQIPLSRSSPILAAYSSLKALTLNSMLFQKNEILVTVRDLIKLCNRITSESLHISASFKPELNLTLRQEYCLTVLVAFYSLVAEKLYICDEKRAVLKSLKQSLMSSSNAHNTTADSSLKKRKVSIDGMDTDATDSSKREHPRVNNLDVSIPFVEMCYCRLLPQVVDMTRLKMLFDEKGYFWIDGYTDRVLFLVVTALRQRENVLLVGDTGIGKTTLFQLLSIHHSVKLNIFNSHQNTDTVDFLGCVKPVHSTALGQNARMNFEFVNGPLINSMINGEWFLFDEISLIEDSILEKINSILEFSSYIIDSSFSGSPSSTEKIKYIYSHPEFRLLGTMNPGNDFGKKELSPSIANRFTKIFVPPIDLTDYKILSSIACRIRSSVASVVLDNSEPSSDDWLVYSIIDILKHINQTAPVDENVAMSSASASQPAAITLRNIITLFEYHYSGLVGSDSDQSPDRVAISARVKSFVDSLYVSILNSYSDKPISEHEIYSIIAKNVSTHANDLHNSPNGLEHFPKPLNNSSYDNIISILQFCLKNVPMVNILLEGNPGVGKTFHVIELARIFNKRLVRINLNEFTDLTDLVGNYVFGESTSAEPDSNPGFIFRYGPLLDAVVSGDWVVLDELNLASPEVLEGINSLLDHRRDIFVPELNTSFKSHPEFRIFATQNTSLSLYRKGLPKSLLNRFVRVHVYDMVHCDYNNILEKPHLSLSHQFVSDGVSDMGRVVSFVMDINSSINTDRKYNVRDLIVLKNLMADYGIIVAVKLVVLNSIISCVGYFNESLLNLVSDTFLRHFGFDLTNSYPPSIPRLFPASPLNILGLSDFPDIYNALCILHPLKIPILFIYSNNHEYDAINTIIDKYHAGIGSRDRTLFSYRTESLSKVQFFSSDDVADLLGSYEYTNNELVFNNIKSHFKRLLSQINPALFMTQLEPDLNSSKGSFSHMNGDYLELDHIGRFVQSLLSTINTVPLDSQDSVSYSSIKQTCETILSLLVHQHKDKKSFGISWVDSKIVKCVQNGDLVIVNRAHLVNSSILDRLNPLLEFDRTLSVNECGFDRKITIHGDFRIFFSAHANHLDKLSYSFFNRCVKIDLRGYKLVNNSKPCLINRLFSSFPYDFSSKLDLKGAFSAVCVFELYNVINTVNTLLRKDYQFPPLNMHLLFTPDHLIIFCLVFGVLSRFVEANKMLIRTFVSKYVCGKLSSNSTKEDLMGLFVAVFETTSQCGTTFTGNMEGNCEISRIGAAIVDHLYDIKDFSPEYQLLSEYVSHLIGIDLNYSDGGTQSVLNDCVLVDLYSKHMGLHKFAISWYLQKAFILGDRVSYCNTLITSNVVQDRTLVKIISDLYLTLDRFDLHGVVLLSIAFGLLNGIRQPVKHGDVAVAFREYIMNLVQTAFKRSLDDECLDLVWRLSFLFDVILLNIPPGDKLDAYFVFYRNLSNHGLDLSILPSGLIDSFALLESHCQADVSFCCHEIDGMQLVSAEPLLSDYNEDRRMDFYIDQLIVSKVTFLVCCSLHSYLTETSISDSIVSSFDQIIDCVREFYTSVQPLVLDVLNSLCDCLKRLGDLSAEQHPELISGILSNLSILYLYSRKQKEFETEASISEIEFLSQLLFDEKFVPPTKTNQNTETNILVNILSSFSTLNLVENLRKLRLVEYLITIPSSDNTLSVVFANIAFLSFFFENSVAKRGSGCFTRLVKSTYRFIIDGKSSGLSLSDVDYDLRTVADLLDSCNLHEDWGCLLNAFKQLRDVCLKFKSCLNFDVWGPLLNLTIELTKSFFNVIPNVQNVVKDLETCAECSFLNHKATELSNLYTTFNILDSLSVGYSINNKHILSLIKKCLDVTRDRPVEIDEIENQLLNSTNTPRSLFETANSRFCSDGKLNMVLEFVNEYTSFVGRYCLNFESISASIKQEDLYNGSLGVTAIAVLNFVSHINNKYRTISNIISYPCYLLLSLSFVSSLTPPNKNIPANSTNTIDSDITRTLISSLRVNPSYFKTAFVSHLVYKSGLENRLLMDVNMCGHDEDKLSHTLLILALEFVHRNRIQEPKTDVVFKLNTIQKAIQALSTVELEDDVVADDPNVPIDSANSLVDFVFSKGILTEYLIRPPNHPSDVYILAIYYLTIISGSGLNCDYDVLYDAVIFDTFLKRRELSRLYRFCCKAGFRFDPSCIESLPKVVDFDSFQNIKPDAVDAIENTNLINVYFLLTALIDYCNTVILNEEADNVQGDSSCLEKSLLVSNIRTTVKNILWNFPKQIDVSLYTLLKTKLATLYKVLDFYGTVGNSVGNQTIDHKLTIAKYVNALQQIVDYFKLSYVNRLRNYNDEILRDYNIQNFNICFKFVLISISNFLFKFVLRPQNGLNSHHDANDHDLKRLGFENMLNELNLIKNGIIGFLFDTCFLNMILISAVFDQIKRLLSSCQFLRLYSPCVDNGFGHETYPHITKFAVVKLVELFDYISNFISRYVKTSTVFLSELDKSYKNEFSINYSDLLNSCRKNTLTSYFERPSNFTIFNKIVETYVTSLNTKFSSLHQQTLFSLNILSEKVLLTHSDNTPKSQLFETVANSLNHVIDNYQTIRTTEIRRILLSTIDVAPDFELTEEPYEDADFSAFVSVMNEHHHKAVKRTEPTYLLYYCGFASYLKTRELYFSNYFEAFENVVANYLSVLQCVYNIEFIRQYPPSNDENTGCRNFNTVLFSKIVDDRLFRFLNTNVHRLFVMILKNFWEFNKRKHRYLVYENSDSRLFLDSPRLVYFGVQRLCRLIRLVIDVGVLVDYYTRSIKYRDESLCIFLEKLAAVNSKMCLFVSSSREYAAFNSLEWSKKFFAGHSSQNIMVCLDFLSSISSSLKEMRTVLVELPTNSISVCLKSTLQKALDLLDVDTFMECMAPLTPQLFCLDSFLSIKQDLERLNEISLFFSHLSRLLYVILFIPDTAKDELEQDGPGQISGGIGLDEGTGLKNVSDQLDQHELNLENQPKQQTDGLNGEPDDQGIDLDIDFDGEDISPEELDEHEELESEQNPSKMPQTDQEGENIPSDLLEDEELEENADESDEIADRDHKEAVGPDPNFPENEADNSGTEVQETKDEEMSGLTTEFQEYGTERAEATEQLEPHDDSPQSDVYENEHKPANADDTADRSGPDRQDSLDYLNMIDELKSFNVGSSYPQQDQNYDVTKSERTTPDQNSNDLDVTHDSLESGLNRFLNSYNIIKQSSFNVQAKRSKLYEYYHDEGPNDRDNDVKAHIAGDITNDGDQPTGSDEDVIMADDAERDERDVSMHQEDVESPPYDTKRFDTKRKVYPKHIEVQNPEDIDNAVLTLNNALLADYRTSTADAAGLEDWPKSGCEVGISEFGADILSNSQLLSLSNALYTQLSIILQPNSSARYVGYFKRGKKLSVKKLLIFLATNYQRNKIWLRKIKPNKKNYLVEVAIDNTKSMANIRAIAVQSLLVIFNAIHKMNIGTFEVIKYGIYQPDVILSNSQTDLRALLTKLTFDEENKYSYELGLVSLMDYVMASTAKARGTRNRILIIITDGKFNKARVRSHVISLINAGILPLLIILDPTNAVLKMKQITNQDGRIKIESYLSNFPFPYYSIISNINQLPSILSDLLKQWINICSRG